MAEPENSGRAAAPERKAPRGKPFQPGQSGNPGGRPKSDLGERIRKATSDGKLLSDVLVAVVRASPEDVDGVLGGDRPKISERIDAIRLSSERGWGKAVQPLEHSGPEGQPLAITIDLGAAK